LPVVQQRPTPRDLRELVDLAMTRMGVDSGRALDTAIVAHYGEDARVSHTIINAILAGRYHSEPSDATVRTLARAAGVTPAAAFRIVGRPMREPFTLPDSAADLTGDQRDAILGVLRAFIRANRATGGVGSGELQQAAYDAVDPAGNPEAEAP
jgi:hypothetical protein